MTNRLSVLLTVAVIVSAAGMTRAEEPSRDVTPSRPEVEEAGDMALVGEYVAIGVGDVVDLPPEWAERLRPAVRDVVIARQHFRKTFFEGSRKPLLVPSPHIDFLGKVETVEGDVLTVRLAGRSEFVTVPRAAIDSLEVRHSQPRAGKGALIGAGAGLALGLVVISTERPDADCDVCTTVNVLFTGATTTVGTAIGALIGAGHTRWERVDPRRLTVAVMPDPRGGIRGRLAIRF